MTPNGASSNGASFSCRACGAWSVATHAIVPSRSASRSAARSSSERSGGFIFRLVSRVRTLSSVRQRWWGETSRADRDPAALRGPDGGHGLPGREMHYMQRSSLICGKGAVALDHHATPPPTASPRARARPRRRPSCICPSRERVGSSSWRARIRPGDGAVLERPLHQARRTRPGLPSSVNAAAPRRGELGHLGQLLAAKALRDRRHEAGRDRRLVAGLLDQGAEHGRRVDDGIRVRHREDGAVATRRGRGRAGGDRLLVLAAGDAEVNVRVDEGRREHERAVRPRRSGSSAVMTPSSIVTSCGASTPPTGSTRARRGS